MSPGEWTFCPNRSQENERFEPLSGGGTRHERRAVAHPLRALGRGLTSLILGAVFASILVSCTDEEVVFQDRELFTSPDPAANGFLGYFDTDEKLTTCGNCHVGKEADWEETNHAQAWAILQNTGSSQAFCESCHTVNELGNPATETSGHNEVPTDRYHDVQCESCHGPGLNHVENPDASQPLANIAVGVDLTFGCGECHQGNHHPFVNQWAESKHAAPWGEFFPGGLEQGAAAAARPECQSCHTGEGALATWGVEASFLEAGTDDPVPHTCAVCHDPHGSENTAMLRFPISTPRAEEHLCARCHNRRTTPDPQSAQGLAPHAPETGLLQGDVGWFPPDARIEPGEIIATHGSEANEGLCATCHVASSEVTDQETGEFVFSATGHTFQAIPCLDEEGVPTAGDCALSVQARSFEGCTAAGCHGSPQAAFSALNAASSRIMDLALELRALLEQVDPNLEEPGGLIDPRDPTFTVAEGAFFNLAVAEFPLRERADPRLVFAGSSAHNPFMTEALLVASIRAVEREFGVSASPGLVVERTLGVR